MGNWLYKGVLIPVSKTGVSPEGGAFLPTAFLCIPCHKQVHALFTNQELAARLNTIDALRQDEKLASYIKWIRKQPASKLVKTKKSRQRRKK
ncbi:HNH endonuclease [Bacillus safensis]|nr:HNH endonuclease [Bacillus safensis]